MKRILYAVCWLFLAFLVFSPVVALAATEGTVTRSVSNSQPSPGDTVTVTIKQSGITSFYAVKENIGALVYSGVFTADSNPGGGTAFTNITPKNFTYEVKVPTTAKAGDKFTITGQFWSDPADKRDIGPTVLTVAGGGATTSTTSPVTVTRSVSSSQPAPGDTVTVSIKQSGVTSFYAVKENIGALVYSRVFTADDNPEGTTFTNISPKNFTYEVKVPATAKAGDKFTITGQFWSDPADKHDIGVTTLTVSGGGTGGTTPNPQQSEFPMPGNLTPRIRDIEYVRPYVDPIRVPQLDYGWIVSTTTLLVADAQMPPTKTVQIPINIINASAVGNMDIKVAYDSSVLQNMDVTKGSLNGDSLFESNIVDGIVSIAFVDNAGINGDGSIAVMQFKVVGKTGDSSTLVATVSANKVQAGEAVTIKVKNGLFTVGDAEDMRGDCDGDGDVDPLDALMALQMSVGKIEVNLVADMNDDGQVTSLDAAEIMKLAVSNGAQMTKDIRELITQRSPNL